MPFACSYLPGQKPAVILLVRYALAAPLLAVGLVAIVWSASRGSWLIPLFIALSIFASLRTAQLRPAARRRGSTTLAPSRY